MLTDLLLLPPNFSLQHIGVAGSLLYMTTFTLLATRVLSGDSIVYFMMNFTAASLVLISLSEAFNAASVLIQSFWIVVSTVSIVARLRRNRPRARSRSLPTDRLRPFT